MVRKNSDGGRERERVVGREFHSLTLAATGKVRCEPLPEGQVEPLDPATAGKLKRFKRVEVNALHLRKSHF